MTLKFKRNLPIVILLVGILSIMALTMGRQHGSVDVRTNKDLSIRCVVLISQMESRQHIVYTGGNAMRTVTNGLYPDGTYTAGSQVTSSTIPA